MSPKLALGLLAATLSFAALAPAAQARPHRMMMHRHHRMMMHRHHPMMMHHYR